ncbi:MAG: phosphoribosylformylglycinamidine cyclo-ligase [Desulfovibrio sp.]|uniref:phosphoribosylformylglycinamidine cyclo-ligase n=1 Tax=Desulfovibrio sp. 7SRBS1 TaxID=3378064 RepID=UPI003B3DFCA9
MSDRASAYKKAGVDIEAGNAFVKNIRDIVKSTYTKGVVTDIGGFGGLFKMDLQGIEEPVLVAGADGVGTKLKLAFALNRHDTVGIDLVAMSVNDVLVQGAKPLFFLDYFATGKLDGDVAKAVVAGVAEGCRQSQCALLGGETAEMPGFYPDGEYDLSGFCVGIVDNNAIVDGSATAMGDKVIGIASSGPHSNGYSLIRKLLDESGLQPDDTLPGSDKTVADALLAPTIIYSKAITNVLRDFEIKGMVHVTGGGFYDNIPRILPKNVAAHINFNSWPKTAVFEWLKKQGNMGWPEMLQIFNCGIGYVVIVSEKTAQDVMQRLEAMGHQAWEIGDIQHLNEGEEQVVVNFAESC